MTCSQPPKPWEEYRAVYLHTPFCVQKCLYCDFASYAGFDAQQMAAYTHAVCHEIAARHVEAQGVNPCASVYFGGGTPSILPLECVEAVVAALKKYGFWQSPCEATIEVNPGTVSLDKLTALRSLGFDRVSLGVQSLNDAQLRTIGRIHTAAQALEAVEMAKGAGFSRISCDVIYGLPHATPDSVKDTLTRLISAGIEHLSVYGLIVEEDTPLARLVDAGKITLPDEDAAADMYEAVQKLLRQAGFSRYEISNYAKNGQYSRHNCVYWQYHPYVAFGAAACGFDGRSRRTACADARQYTRLAAQLTEADWQGSSLYDVEQLTPAMQLEEFMFMGLRQTCGANLAEAGARFGVDVMQRFGGALQPFLTQGLAEYDAAAQHLRLTERGMAVGNQIFEVFVIT